VAKQGQVGLSSVARFASACASLPIQLQAERAPDADDAGHRTARGDQVAIDLQPSRIMARVNAFTPD